MPNDMVFLELYLHVCTVDVSAKPIHIYIYTYIFLEAYFIEILFTHHLLLIFITHIFNSFHFVTHANLNSQENFFI